MEQLTLQISWVFDVLEQGYMDRIRLIVREGEGPHMGHGAAGRSAALDVMVCLEVVW